VTVAAKKKAVPKGFHKMPNGKMMKGKAHSESAKHERTESKAEKKAEYGPKAKSKGRK